MFCSSFRRNNFVKQRFCFKAAIGAGRGTPAGGASPRVGGARLGGGVGGGGGLVGGAERAGVNDADEFLGHAKVSMDDVRRLPSSRQIIPLTGRPKGVTNTSGSVTVEVSLKPSFLNN